MSRNSISNQCQKSSGIMSSLLKGNPSHRYRLETLSLWPPQGTSRFEATKEQLATKICFHIRSQISTPKSQDSKTFQPLDRSFLPVVPPVSQATRSKALKDLNENNDYAGWGDSILLDTISVDYLRFLRITIGMGLLTAISLVGFRYHGSGKLPALNFPSLPSAIPWKLPGNFHEQDEGSFLADFPVRDVPSERLNEAMDMEKQEGTFPELQSVDFKGEISADITVSEQATEENMSKFDFKEETITGELPEKVNRGEETRAEMKKVNSVVDKRQLKIFQVLQNLEIIEQSVAPNEICSRRNFARWLVTSSEIFSRNPGEKIHSAMFIEGLTELGFEDISPEDPDFGVIQGLAEAGVIPSQLSTRDSSIKFNPDLPITRQDLITWRMAASNKILPPGTVEDLEVGFGVLDVANVDPTAVSSILADLGSQKGQSLIQSAFGFSKRLQPNQAVTRQQAAASLAVGDNRSELVCQQFSAVSVRWQQTEEAMWNDLLEDMRADISVEVDKARASLELERKLLERAKKQKILEDESVREAMFAFECEMMEISMLKAKLSRDSS